jgi:hypothetical protein
MDDNRDRECSECDEEDWVSEEHGSKLKKIPDKTGIKPKSHFNVLDLKDGKVS